MSKLLLGCGDQRIEGFIGLDLFKCKGADVKCDLNGNLPFSDNVIDELIAEHIIEHLKDVTHFLREINRVCADGAKITIVTPHFASFNSWLDPTHIQHLSVFSIDDYCDNPTHFKFGGFTLDRIKLSFPGSPGSFIGRMIFSISKRQYEKSWCFIFRPGNITWNLSVKKSS